METKDILKHLNKLCQLDIDAVASYEQAISNIDDANMSEKLEQFKNDHQRHINDLSGHIRQHGGEPPEQKPGAKGFFLKSFTSIRAATGTEGALKAMRSNENTTNKHYSEAVEWDMPDDIKHTIKKGYEDEQRHLSYIENALRDRPWEQRPQP